MGGDGQSAERSAEKRSLTPIPEEGRRGMRREGHEKDIQQGGAFEDRRPLHDQKMRLLKRGVNNDDMLGSENNNE